MPELHTDPRDKAASEAPPLRDRGLTAVPATVRALALDVGVTGQKISSALGGFVARELVRTGAAADIATMRELLDDLERELAR